MPELPEVETIKIGLQKRIVGLKITKIQVNSPKSFIGNLNQVEGRKVIKVWRRGKILGIDLKTEDRQVQTLLFHLKMSGQIIVQSDKGKGQSGLSTKHSALTTFIGGHPTQDMKGEMPNSHTRVIFEFSDKSKLFFNDQRRFGWIRVSDKGKVLSDKSIQNLGPEPLEKGFNWQTLKSNLLNHKSIPVKVAIMDQSVVAGVGNIYANEACFDAKLDPKIKVKDLSNQQFRKLYQGILKSLKDGIKYGGSSRAHFVDTEGHKGYFLDYAFVYGRDKHPCKKCGTQIKKIQLGGRGTYFCPNCQK